MKFKAMAIAATAVLIAIIYYSFVHKDNIQSDATPAPPTGASPAPSGDVVATGPYTGHAFSSGGKASDYIEKINSSSQGMAEGQKMAYLKQIALFCQGKELSTPEQYGAQSEEEIASLRFTKNYADQFCDQSIDFSAVNDRVMSIDSGDDVIMAYGLSVLDSTGKSDDARKVAEELIENSDSPSAREIAARYLLLLGNGRLSVAEDLPVPRTLQNIQEAQMLAVKKLNCQSHGGCGPNGFFSLLECSSVLMCHSGVSAEETWKRKYSSDTLDYANSVYNRLQQRRSNAGN